MPTEIAPTGVATPIETPPALLTVISQSNLEPATAEGLLNSYRPLFIEAHDLIAKAQAAPVVTDATQLTEMKAAKRLRLDLGAVRVKADKLRAQLKEDSLRRGNAIQGVYSVLLYMVKPIEDKLEESEKFAERAEAARKLALKTEREAALAPFGIDTRFYVLADMTVAAFQQLFDNTKTAHEAKIAAVAKAEADRIAKEKADADERERVRAENERLKQEAIALEAKAKADREAAEATAAAERKRVEAEKAQAAAAAKAELDRREALAADEREKAAKAAAEIRRVAELNAAKAAEQAAKEKAALEAKANEERQAREKIEAEQRAAKKAEDERISVEAAARAKKAADEAEAAKKAAAAPDKEKLRAFAEQLWSMKLPELTTEGGLAILATLKTQHEKYIAWITKQSEAL